jgi:ubiquinone biosynthesis protein COQ4
MRNPLTLVKLAVAAVRLVRDTDRLDEVFAIADSLDEGGNELQLIVDHAHRDPQGARALRERPRVELDLPRLRTLPDGTFGREVARFFDERGLDPASIPRLEHTDATSWLRAHLYETHDLWHVATGFETDVAGEVGLQAFYQAQMPTRLSTILIGLVFLNTFLFEFDDRDRRMAEIARGWTLGRALHRHPLERPLRPTARRGPSRPRPPCRRRRRRGVTARTPSGNVASSIFVQD